MTHADRTRAVGAAAPRGRASDSGIALIEVIVSIVILITVVAVLLTALLTLVTSSSVHRDDVAADFMLRSSAESILGRQTPYADCASPSSYQGAVPVDPEGLIDVTVVSVRVWNGSTPPGFQAVCTVDTGASLITLRASKSDGTAVDELEIVKRRSGS